MTLAGDTRGATSIGMGRFFLSVFVVGVLCFWILDTLGGQLLSGAANATSNATANQATAWFQDFTGMVPVIIILIAFLGMVIYGVYAREINR